MADVDLPSDDPALAAIARHALHDEELIAAYAADDLESPLDVDRARSLVERCPTCRDLRADLASIRVALRATSSAPDRAVMVTAPRDFRLTTVDAERLRPGSPIKRIAARLGWRARLGNGVAAFGRPLGAAMATFGLVGLLVGSITLGGARLTAMGSSAGAEATFAPGIDQAGGTPEATDARSEFTPLSTGKDGVVAGPPTEGTAGGLSTGSIVIGGSAVLLVAGLALLLVARRRALTLTTGSGN